MCARNAGSVLVMINMTLPQPLRISPSTASRLNWPGPQLGMWRPQALPNGRMTIQLPTERHVGKHCCVRRDERQGRIAVTRTFGRHEAREEFDRVRIGMDLRGGRLRRGFQEMSIDFRNVHGSSVEIVLLALADVVDRGADVILAVHPFQLGQVTEHLDAESASRSFVILWRQGRRTICVVRRLTVRGCVMMWSAI